MRRSIVTAIPGNLKLHRRLQGKMAQQAEGKICLLVRGPSQQVLTKEHKLISTLKCLRMAMVFARIEVPSRQLEVADTNSCEVKNAETKDRFIRLTLNQGSLY